MPLPAQDGSVNYRHGRRAPAAEEGPPRRLPQGAVPDSTIGGLSGPGWQVHTLAGGQVVRFDPDRPIGVRLNLDQASRGAMDDVAQALWFLHQASGLVFELDKQPIGLPQAADYTRKDHERPTLSIAWAKPGPGPGGSDLLDADELRRTAPDDRPEGSLARAVGVGGWRVERVTGEDGLTREAIATAIVVLDSTAAELLRPGFGNGPCRGAALLHEIAHASGLGHVADPAQLMYPVSTALVTAFGSGDLEGLTRVGAAAGPIEVVRTVG